MDTHSDVARAVLTELKALAAPLCEDFHTVVRAGWALERLDAKR